MSTIHIHIGQCGNQLSVPLWKNFTHCKTFGNESVFCSLDGWHRSIHIDSESKVLTSLPKTFKVREKNVIVGKRGRGTNFALGYHGIKCQGDDQLLENSMEAIRKEVERCDIYSGAVVYQSISGGTGSGLGSHLVEMLRDDYPCHQILSCAVAPCVSGESPLQNFNALLSLHWLQTYADAVILLLNDYYITHLNQLLESDESLRNSHISFKDINSVIANNLSGVLLPTDTLSSSRGITLGQEPWELIRTLTPMPTTKFISLTQHTSKTLSWEGLSSKVLDYQLRYSCAGNPTHSLSAVAVARGDRENSFMRAVKESLDRKIRKGVNFINWNPYPLDCWTAKFNSIGSKESRSLTLATNSTNILDHLNTVLSRSRLKLDSGAYLHWYHRYGISQEVFNESLETLQTVVSDYESMAKS
ncbi:unnamed protein product [Lymnaea stagnalis]|uniref:Tubulin delta chain n=1 Tax=Lymnaea stagnalis TaxID=6523 RepID=A0AAV2GZ06_LYMST